MPLYQCMVANRAIYLVSYTRFFGNYIGVTGGLNTQTWYSIDCRPLWEVTGRDGKVYHLDDDDDKYANVNVYVGPSFRLPLLTFGRDEDYTLLWECTPAITFTFPNKTFTYTHITSTDGYKSHYETRHAHNRGGQWHYWQLRNALSLKCDEIVLSLGYAFSNQKPFSPFSHVRFDGKNISGFVPNKKTTHEIYLSLGYCF
ncbi:MAG: hypothetical protein MR319_02385 [Mediterranea sp.]|nr:hypothetical protein [Mediterranea sp.]